MCDCQTRSLPRREFLASTGSLAAAALLTSVGSLASFGAEPAQSAEGLDPLKRADEVLARLLEGNARYVSGKTNPRDFAATRQALAESQAPGAVILGCADSRVGPELAFDQSRGDLFVVRVAGNVLSEFGLASIEYALHVLKTPLVIVLGHSHCGAVDAAITMVDQGQPLPGHLSRLAEAIRPAVLETKGIMENRLGKTIKANVRLTANKLSGSGPIVSEMVSKKQVKIVGATYDLATGRVTLLK